MKNLYFIPFIFTSSIILYFIYQLFRTGIISSVTDKLNIVIQDFTALPAISTKRLGVSLYRVLSNNWYSVLVILLLWLVLFRTAVGMDTIEDYLSNVTSSNYIERIPSFWFLFLTIFLNSLCIWIIPFFVYTDKRKKGIIRNHFNYYIATKLLAVLAIIPFYVLASAFFMHSFKDEKPSSIILIIFNLIVIIALSQIHQFINKLIKLYIRFISDFFKKLNFNNKYIELLTCILISEFFLVIIAALIITPYNSDYIICGFLYLSSAIIFRFLFFTNGANLTRARIRFNVRSMIGASNAKENRVLYISLLVILLLINVYYYIVPSLTATNSIYIILSIFSLYIYYLDFFRNWYQTDILWKKILSAFAIIMFLTSPILSPPEQFDISFLDLDKSLLMRPIHSENVFKSDTSIRAKYSLEKALEDRINYIKGRGSNNYFYIICGMGGGSRAGYMTSSFLQKIENEYPQVWDQTVCYSTISGSSPGVYHYLKARNLDKTKRSQVLDNIYLQNYNSSGVYGLLLGDPFDALFGGIFNRIQLNSIEFNTKYKDRNVRIKSEYDIAMNNALIDTTQKHYPFNEIRNGYIDKTFGRNLKNFKQDNFKEFFIKNGSKIPVHLINTFEVASGRRTIISPYIVNNTKYFSNTILPLQNPVFEPNILKKDITYRDATNLSELFPFFSAASTIGRTLQYQFVDGGYFENYGLATAMDVANILIQENYVPKERIKIILIKNSKQVPEYATDKKAQLLAPFYGILNAPFTGHANHYLYEARKIYGDTNFIRIEFNSDTVDQVVPLTRALTGSQISTMKTYVKKYDLKSLSLLGVHK